MCDDGSKSPVYKWGEAAGAAVLERNTDWNHYFGAREKMARSPSMSVDKMRCGWRLTKVPEFRVLAGDPCFRFELRLSTGRRSVRDTACALVADGKGGTAMRTGLRSTRGLCFRRIGRAECAGPQTGDGSLWAEVRCTKTGRIRALTKTLHRCGGQLITCAAYALNALSDCCDRKVGPIVQLVFGCKDAAIYVDESTTWPILYFDRLRCAMAFRVVAFPSG